MDFDPDAPAAPGSLYGLPFTVDAARAVVVAVPWQATTSYRRGTRDGPRAISEASAQLDLFDVDFGAFWEQGIAMLPEDPELRALDLEAEPDALAVIAGDEDADALRRVNQLGERVNGWVHSVTRRILLAGKIPAIVGGDHSVPFGAMQAVSELHPGIGVLHIDAHADLRDAYEGFVWSHASIFHNVLHRLPGVARVVQVGVRDVGAAEVALARALSPRVVSFYDRDLASAAAEGRPWQAVVQQIVDALPPLVWISLDIDGLDPALCPGTGTPVPGGLSFRELTGLLVTLSRQRKIVGFDLDEVGPSEWDGNVGMRVLYKLLGASVCSGHGEPRRGL